MATANWVLLVVCRTPGRAKSDGYMNREMTPNYITTLSVTVRVLGERPNRDIVNWPVKKKVDRPTIYVL